MKKLFCFLFLICAVITKIEAQSVQQPKFIDGICAFKFEWREIYSSIYTYSPLYKAKRWSPWYTNKDVFGRRGEMVIKNGELKIVFENCSADCEPMVIYIDGFDVPKGARKLKDLRCKMNTTYSGEVHYHIDDMHLDFLSFCESRISSRSSDERVYAFPHGSSGYYLDGKRPSKLIRKAAKITLAPYKGVPKDITILWDNDNVGIHFIVNKWRII